MLSTCHRRDEPLLDRDQRGLGAIGDVEFLKNLTQPVADRLLGQVKLSRNRAIVVATRQQPQDIAFTRGEAFNDALGCGRTANGSENLGRQGWIQGRFAPCHPLNFIQQLFGIRGQG